MLKSGFFFKMELNVCLGKLLDVSVGWGLGKHDKGGPYTICLKI